MSMLQDLQRPAALRPGDTIGVVAPSCWLDEGKIQAATALLEQAGYRVHVQPQVHARHNIFAGDDATRAQGVMEAFCNPEIRAILCARGGSGAYRVVDLLDYEVIARNPKIFCGFSDMTALLHILQRRSRLVTYHGTMLWGLVTHADPRLTQHLLDMLAGNVQDFPMDQTHVLNSGTAQGCLLGGNLSVFLTLLGTPDQPDPKGKILFLEDLCEEYYAVDRSLHHMKRAGMFEGIAGFILGEMVDMHDKADNGPYGISLAQMLHDVLPPGIPVVMNAPCGHGSMLATYPLGVPVRFEATASGATLRLMEAAVG